jgi:phosphoribosyl-ATP pyrophosphohydrolase/phosphoribosyl-AMP cyclohydrolase
MSVGLSLSELWAKLAPDVSGLVAALIVHAEDGRVLMLGYMNRDALAATLATREVTLFSRSKQRLWKKGETSGHVLELHSLRIDCDGDALLLEARPRGPTCHTGTSSCFFQPVELPELGTSEPVILGETDDGPRREQSAIELLWATILERKAGLGMTNAEGRSYVRSLLEKGPDQIGAKLREEADELARAIADEADDRVAGEAADLLFHALVGLALRDVPPAVVASLIRARHGLSGIDERALR